MSKQQHEPLTLKTRELLFQKLYFMAGAVGGIADRHDTPSTNDCIAMMSILYEIADQIFPEGNSNNKRVKLTLFGTGPCLNWWGLFPGRDRPVACPIFPIELLSGCSCL